MLLTYILKFILYPLQWCNRLRRRPLTDGLSSNIPLSSPLTNLMSKKSRRNLLVHLLSGIYPSLPSVTVIANETPKEKQEERKLSMTTTTTTTTITEKPDGQKKKQQHPDQPLWIELSILFGRSLIEIVQVMLCSAFGALYFCSRVYLCYESVRTVFYLPPGAYQTPSWPRYLPHIT